MEISRGVGEIGGWDRRNQHNRACGNANGELAGRREVEHFDGIGITRLPDNSGRSVSKLPRETLEFVRRDASTFDDRSSASRDWKGCASPASRASRFLRPPLITVTEARFVRKLIL